MSLSQHLDKLEAFTIIAETKKISQASRLINLSQPSLTRLIDTLEENVGTKLFIRSRNGTILTPAGEELYSYAKSILNPLQDLESRLKKPSDMTSGHIKAGSFESLAEYLWPNFLKEVKNKFPNLHISIKTTYAKTHTSALETGDVDFLVDAEPRIVGDLDSYPLYSDYFSIYIKKSLLSPKRSSIAPLPIIYVPNAFDQENKSLEFIVSTSSLAENERIELDSFTTARTFCEKGLGLTILPTRLVKNSPRRKQLSLVKIDDLPSRFGKHTIYMTIHSRKLQDPRIQLLRKELRNHLK